MNTMEGEDKKPVPAPRRHVPELRKHEYENVAIDLINKNVNIKSENIQAKPKEKCLDKKVFLFPDTSPTVPKVYLTEKNNIHEDVNQNISEPDYVAVNITPIPAPRKPNNFDVKVDESYYQTPRSPEPVFQEVQVKRKAPDIPQKFDLTPEKPLQRTAHSSSNLKSEAIGDISIDSSMSTISSSSTTLNSSMDDSASGANEHPKYKSPRPGYVPPPPPTRIPASCSSSDPNDLLKSISATSKLLTESIGERVAMKAKGAKQKLDKNLKSSQDLINNLSADASLRLKNVSKKINTIGNNLTLTKRDRKKESTPEFDVDRPQTVPPNDTAFHTMPPIKPLSKTNGVTDLNRQSCIDDGAYDVPRNVRVQSLHEDYPCPSYEDAVKPPMVTASFPRNKPSSRSLMIPRSLPQKQTLVPLSKQRSNPNLDSSSCEDISLPMPKFPPPPLRSEPPQATDNALYGKLNPIVPPVRQKRKKIYEQIELRYETPSSTRASIDSTEIRIRQQEEAARLESIELKEKIFEEETRTPKPERSDSWEYHEKSDDDGCSSPEPIYANQEATYGKLCDMECSSKDLLTPHLQNLNIGEEESAVLKSPQLAQHNVHATDVLIEFDPLAERSTISMCDNSKSNQLLLLEHMLEEDTYGRIPSDTQSVDEQSLCTSEEDNSTVSSSNSSKVLTDKCNTCTEDDKTPNTPTSSLPKMQIVHQNPNLHSESMENIIEECDIKPYLSRIDETPPPTTEPDLARPSRNQTKWFVTPDTKSPTVRENPFNKLQHFEGESPPSYIEAISGTDSKQTSYFTSDFRTKTSKLSQSLLSNVRHRVGALKRKTSFRVSRSTDVKVPITVIPRPQLSPHLVRHEGPLIRFPSGVVEDILKEMQNRKAILRDRQFQTYLDQEMKNPKETIPLEHITTLQCVSNSRVTDNSTHLYCFEITTAIPKCNASQMQMSNPNIIMSSGTSGNCKVNRICHLYGVGKESERSIWMQKIFESLTNVFPTKYTCHFYRAGWCYLKNSITSEWSGSWLLLKKIKRRLLFATEANMNVEKMDLRKARCIVLKDNDDSIENLHVEKGPMLMIDCPPFTIYMIMPSSRETKVWRHIIREVAHNNGPSLEEQQLTKFDVPVLIDKCINFVYIHGSMSEGIYRKSGSENSILKLLAHFRADAFNVEITRNEYNEHDVANVLKRFMRDLPTRLLGKTSQSFISITNLDTAAGKIMAYKELLSRLHVIERETLKKIIGHLSFINSQKDRNKMGVNNLAMIWGPTLLQNVAEEMTYSQKEADVIVDLVTLYKNLFPLSESEVKREHEMLLCLQKYYAAAETLTDAVKKSGDLKMWVTLNPGTHKKSEERDQVNVTITPTKTSYEICQELAPRMNAATHEVTLYEVILNGNLERPLHHETKVFDAVLSWSYWPEEDRKQNNLVLKYVDVLKDVQRAVKNMATLTPGKELKFADKKTKSFKSYQVELRDGKIAILKREKNGTITIMREIFLHGVTVYLGCEKKRDFQWSWALTFVENNKKQILRSRDSPYIGHVVAGSEWVDKTIWFSSIWYYLYGENILPPAEIIMK